MSVLELFCAVDDFWMSFAPLWHHTQVVLPLSVGDNSFSPHRLTILLDPAYSTF